MRSSLFQSGTVLVPWAFSERKELEGRALNLSKIVGCPQDNLDVIMNCLRRVHPTKLVNNEFFQYGVVEFPFTPFIDGSFLDYEPREALRRGDYKKTSILIGTNTEEGFYYAMYFLPQLLKLREDVVVTRQEFRDAVREFHPHLSNLSIDAIVFQVCFMLFDDVSRFRHTPDTISIIYEVLNLYYVLLQYTDWAKSEDTITNRNMIDRLVGDYNFGCPVDDFGLKYAEDNNDVYLYQYTHRYSTHPYPKWTGVLHGDEVPIIFGDPLKPSKGYQTAEVKFSKAIMKYWANFARTG